MYVLGISGALGHDPAACLMRDGEVIAMIEEERISRSSHALGALPTRSAEFCLNKANITLDQVDYIALSWDKGLIEEKKQIPAEKYYNTRYDNIYNLFPKEVFSYKKFPKVEVVDHHLSHAASTFYFSPFKESSVLVIDGAGENCSTTLFHGKENRLIKLESIHHHESLGIFYDAVTEYLGFGWTEAGKTMGLASFGKPEYEFEKIKYDGTAGYTIEMDHSIIFDKVLPRWKRDFLRMGIKPNNGQRIYQPKSFKNTYLYKFSEDQVNFAASAQRVIEDAYESLVRNLVGRTKSRNLCLAGGVALNCVANGKISYSNLVDDVFIQPASNDPGTALGAAAEVMSRSGFSIKPINNAYFGPSFTNDEIESFLKHVNVNYRYSSHVYEESSKLIEQGKIVGWFQGEAEIGPRALGNRSILADPSMKNVQDHVNNRIKLREPFRPFGPSVLEEEASGWFDNITSSPFMLKAYRAMPNKANLIKGVVHFDNTSRPQTVNREQNLKYYKLIESFYAQTKIPMVLNTSFNLKGEPMVSTPYDALRTFYSSGLDALVLNDFIITKF